MIHISTREVFTLFDPDDEFTKETVAAAFKVHESYEFAKMYVIHWDYGSAYWTVNEIELL